MTSIRLSTFALAALLLTLAACGKKDNADNPAPAAQGSEQTDRKLTSNGIEIEEGGGLLLPRQPLLPFERYTVLDQSRNFRTKDQAETTQVEKLYRNVFWAGAVRDDDLLAYDFLPEVRAEKDAFKRADIVKAKRAELDTAYAEARKQKHYALYLDRDFLMSIGPYDAQKKGFPVSTGIRGDMAYGWSKPKEHAHNEHASWMIEFAGSDLPENLGWYIPGMKPKPASSKPASASCAAIPRARSICRAITSDTSPTSLHGRKSSSTTRCWWSTASPSPTRPPASPC